MAATNTQVLLKEVPVGWPDLDKNFEIVHTPFDAAAVVLAEGELLVKNLYISLDPYMRGRMNVGVKSYTASFTLGKPLQAGGVAEVLRTNSASFAVGDIVSAMTGWEQYSVLNSATARKVDTTLPFPLTYHLGIYGMPGMTAYIGLLKLFDSEPKAGQTVYVSGAAGAVGQVVGQIAKLKGCHVVGSAGSDEKVKFLLEECKYDSAFNYKKVASLDAAFAEHCPNGIDFNFENVGGEMLDTVFKHMNVHGRMGVCGMISNYNSTSETAYGLKNTMTIVGKQLNLRGFIVTSFMAEHGAAFAADMGAWIKEGKIVYREDVATGIENAPKAFLGMLRGENFGKQLVKIA